jgi:RNA polymerase sigma-70 factor, ECF subfamily
MDEIEAKRAHLVRAAQSRLAEIHAFFRRLGVDHATAEDLGQDTFLVAWENASRLRGERQLRGWLYGIAYRRYLKHREKTRGRETVTLGEEIVEVGVDPGSDQSLDVHVVRAALRSLPEIYQHALVLVYWQGLSYREAARALSLPIGTLAWRVHKALGLMEHALAEKGLNHGLATHPSSPDREAPPICED